MALEFDVFERPTHVHLLVSGHWTAATSQQMRRRAIDECARRGRGRALIDARELSGLPALHQSFQAAEDFAGAAAGALQQVAIVDLGEYRASYEFYELVAKNRGLNVRFFTDPRAAAAWLGERADDDRAAAGRRRPRTA